MIKPMQLIKSREAATATAKYIGGNRLRIGWWDKPFATECSCKKRLSKDLTAWLYLKIAIGKFQIDWKIWNYGRNLD